MLAVEQFLHLVACIIPTVTNNPELKGRFLHITDIHPDPHYVTGGTYESACHRRQGKKTARGKDKRRLSDPDADSGDFDDDDEQDEDEDGGDDDRLNAAKKRKAKERQGGAGRWGDALT